MIITIQFVAPVEVEPDKALTRPGTERAQWASTLSHQERVDIISH